MHCFIQIQCKQWCDVKEFQLKKNLNFRSNTGRSWKSSLPPPSLFAPPPSLCIRRVCDCYLPPTDPAISLNNARLQKDMCWFVIRTDKLISCVQVGLAGSLHDDVTLLQVHLFFFFRPILSSQWHLSSANRFYLQKKKEKKTWRAHWEVRLSCSCHAYQVVCRALTFFVSQVRTVKYIQWMIFSRYPLPVVQCNTLETMQVFFFFFFSVGVTRETVLRLLLFLFF